MAIKIWWKASPYSGVVFLLQKLLLLCLFWFHCLQRSVNKASKIAAFCATCWLSCVDPCDTSTSTLMVQKPRGLTQMPLKSTDPPQHALEKSDYRMRTSEFKCRNLCQHTWANSRAVNRHYRGRTEHFALVKKDRRTAIWHFNTVQEKFLYLRNKRTFIVRTLRSYIV